MQENRASTPVLGRSPAEGNDKKSLDRGGWGATVHGITESDMTEQLTLSFSLWTFFDIAFLWGGNETWPFPVLWTLQSFPKWLAYLSALSFRILNSSVGIPSPPLALYVVMLPKVQLTSLSRVSGSRWVTTPSFLSGSLRFFFFSQFFCVFLPPILNLFCFC